MKISQENLDHDNATEVNEGPKLRNIHDVAEVPDEKPEGIDIRFKIAAIVILVLTLFVGIKGSITKSSLESQLTDAKKAYTEAHAEALLYGIVEDEDGELVIPETQSDTYTDVSELDWDSIEVRNKALLDEFTTLVLKWDGKSQYDKNRQVLIDEWEFTEDSPLLKSFMTDDDPNASMFLVGYEPYVLTDDGKNISYFLICTVRVNIDGKAADGTVGILITINADGTISDVVAQTLS